MSDQNILRWLLDGDISIRYQAYRDLLDTEKPRLQARIANEGWGLQFLSRRKQNGHWGLKFYQPKWISTHYTLLDLKNLSIAPDHPVIKASIDLILDQEKGPDGGIRPIGANRRCDVCINGMVLNYACYFGAAEKALKSVVDFLLAEKMGDGGFNCRSTTIGATHSSLHTTLSVAEGITEYRKNGYTYRLKDLLKAQKESEEFMLMHRLFRSDRTGQIIRPDFIKLYYPGRWYYDILKALDYFQYSGVPYDCRMDDALTILKQKRTADGAWKLAAPHPGHIHFEMEQAGKPSRWNTLRALRVLKFYP